MRFVPSVSAIALAAALASPATAQTADSPVTWGEVFAPDRLAKHVLNLALTSARAAIYLTYEDIAIDVRGGAATLSGAVIRPFPEGHPTADCTVTLDRLRIAGVPLEETNKVVLDITGEGADLGLDCLPQDALPFVAAMGVDAIRADMLRLSVRYDYPSSGMVADFSADLPGLVAASVRAEFDYVALQPSMDFDDEPLPMGDLSRAEATLVDQGIWDAASRILPPEMMSGDALAFGVSQMLTDILTEMNWSVNGQQPLSSGQREFVSAAADVARQLPDGPREIVLSLAPDPAPLRLSATALEDATPSEVFDALNPQVRLGLVDQVQMIPVALLERAFDAPKDLTDDERRQVGLALLTGTGAPRDVGSAFDLLEPLLGSDPTLVLALALAEASYDAANAYGLALDAAARGAPGALTLLDQLEVRIGMAEAVTMQPLAPEGPGDVTSRAHLASRARAAMIGQGAPRSYQAAAYWAGLAAAAGDTSAASLLEQLNAKMARAGHDGWAEQQLDVAAQVLDDWIDSDLPARLTSR